METTEDRGKGWLEEQLQRMSIFHNQQLTLATCANTTQFVEYDPRAHRLVTLASFSFWVSSKLLHFPGPFLYILIICR